MPDDRDYNTGQILEVPVGNDLFVAQLIERAAQAEGFNVQLRIMRTEGITGLRADVHRLLVHELDADDVQVIIDRSLVD